LRKIRSNSASPTQEHSPGATGAPKRAPRRDAALPRHCTLPRPRQVPLASASAPTPRAFPTPHAIQRLVPRATCTRRAFVHLSVRFAPVKRDGRGLGPRARLGYRGRATGAGRCTLKNWPVLTGRREGCASHAWTQAPASTPPPNRLPPSIPREPSIEHRP
jgi:hypothetical protein